MTTVINHDELEQDVRETEQAFARTMADRDIEAFARFLSDETVFFAGETPLRGKEAVVTAWESFFTKSEAPFSWEPKTVVVLDSGKLALSSGPVHGPEGEVIGTFNSIWRREEPGIWRIIFDKGS